VIFCVISYRNVSFPLGLYRANTTYFYVYRYACDVARLVVDIQHSIGCLVVFPGMMSSLAKSKQIICAHFQTFFSTIFLFFDVPQYSNIFHYIKHIRPALYFNSQKIIAYHLQIQISRGSLGAS